MIELIDKSGSGRVAPAEKRWVFARPLANRKNMVKPQSIGKGGLTCIIAGLVFWTTMLMIVSLLLHF